MVFCRFVYHCLSKNTLLSINCLLKGLLRHEENIVSLHGKYLVNYYTLPNIKKDIVIL